MHAQNQHPLATHPAGAVLSYRADGRPIYPIAGGSNDDGGGTPAATPSALQ
jgi:hypothetical protein